MGSGVGVAVGAGGVVGVGPDSVGIGVAGGGAGPGVEVTVEVAAGGDTAVRAGDGCRVRVTVGPDCVGIGVADGPAGAAGLRSSPIRETAITITATAASDTASMPRRCLLNWLLASPFPARA